MRRLLLPLLFVGCVAAPSFESAHFAPITNDLLAFAERQAFEQQLPGVWIALLEVDPTTGEEHQWAGAVTAGVDSARGPVPQSLLRAGPDVLATHRVASISKLFTATAAMVLVERGELDLDVDVRHYLPEFAPDNPFDAPITLRHLMGHRAGVVREPPVGHYFDPSEPTLAATVASLNGTRLVSAPGEAFKYSNPGVGVVGEVIARVTGEPFEDAVRELVLAPLGLHDSDFAARADLVERQSGGVMWTYDGRDIPTPSFRFGYVPAAELRSTVVDLVHFARSWFANASPRVLSDATQRAMWQLPAGERYGCGLGFFVSEFDEGQLRVEHGGAAYGFASSLVALPEQGIAVAVVCTKDFANGVCDAIADRALRAALANRRGETLPPPQHPTPLGADVARAFTGCWRAGDNWAYLYERGGDLYYDPNVGVRTRLRRAADGAWIPDDPLALGGGRRLTLLPNGNPHDGEVEYVRERNAPPPAPDELREYLGEYGWDHDVLIVYEDHGNLGVLIEWVVRDLPEREAKDRWRFPPGMYTADQLVFERDANGEITAAVVGGARFARRPGPTAGTFRMPLTAPMPELIAAAKRAAPPTQPDGLRAFDLVDLTALDGGRAQLLFDIRYATTNNFTGAKLYDRPIAKLQREAADALLRAHRSLYEQGLGIVVFDAYRPWHVTKAFWDAAPEQYRHFVANPANGSRHNRGCAVDVSLYELSTGDVVTMPSGFDEFTERAYADYPGGTQRQRHYREVLRRAMEEQGFNVYEHEWWHFDFHTWREYPVGSEPL